MMNTELKTPIKTYVSTRRGYMSTISLDVHNSGEVKLIFDYSKRVPITFSFFGPLIMVSALLLIISPYLALLNPLTLFVLLFAPYGFLVYRFFKALEYEIELFNECLANSKNSQMLLEIIRDKRFGFVQVVEKVAEEKTNG